MRWLFNTFNHDEAGRRSLEDIITVMAQQLVALGHEAAWDPKNANFLTSGGYNVVIEGFTPATVRELARVHGLGGRFIIVATEEPTERGFNHGTQAKMADRQAIFPEAAKFADGILHLVPGGAVTRWYSQHAPAAQAELGYAPGLMRLTGQEPDYDFGFYGSLTPRRLKIVKRLAGHVGSEKAVRIVADFKSQTDRDAEMRRAKVVVQIRKFEAMGLVSSSRCNTALSLGRPVVAEPHELSHPWDEVISFPKTMGGFFANALFARAAWRGTHAAQLAKFKEKFSPEFCLGAPLRRIGIGETRRAA